MPQCAPHLYIWFLIFRKLRKSIIIQNLFQSAEGLKLLLHCKQQKKHVEKAIEPPDRRIQTAALFLKFCRLQGVLASALGNALFVSIVGCSILHRMLPRWASETFKPCCLRCCLVQLWICWLLTHLVHQDPAHRQKFHLHPKWLESLEMCLVLHYHQLF